MMALTREQALDVLLRVEVELRELQTRRNDLREIVLSQQFEYSAVHKTSPNGGPRPSRGSRGEVAALVLRIMREHGAPITATELANLAANGITSNAYGQTFGRLQKKGLVTCDKSKFPRRWSLAVHPDTTELRTRAELMENQQ
jgi:hypothetical protein